MIIQGASPAPAPTPTLKSMFNAVLDNTQQSQTPQASTIVKLSTQGQALSLATTLLAPAPKTASPASAAAPITSPAAATSMAPPAQMHNETNETSGQEINETGSVRFAEGEKSGQAAGSETASNGDSVNPVSTQSTAVAVPATRSVSIFA
ncbi:MAG: hypothetical protein WC216_04980 [Gallionella sp.]|jgi:hypothetical protein